VQKNSSPLKKVFR